MMWFLLACSSPAPVVQGVKAPSAEEVTLRRQQQEVRATPENLVVTYKKAEGVYVEDKEFKRLILNS